MSIFECKVQYRDVIDMRVFLIY